MFSLALHIAITTNPKGAAVVGTDHVTLVLLATPVTEGGSVVAGEAVGLSGTGRIGIRRTAGGA